MSATTERNKRIRYFRMRMMYEYLQELRFASDFCEEAVMTMFNVSNSTVFNARTEPLIADLKYRYLNLDKAWIDAYVKDALKRNREKDKPEAATNQRSLQL